jgi:hypothetical protein
MPEAANGVIPAEGRDWRGFLLSMASCELSDGPEPGRLCEISKDCNTKTYPTAGKMHILSGGVPYLESKLTQYVENCHGEVLKKETPTDPAHSSRWGLGAPRVGWRLPNCNFITLMW